MSKKKPLAGAEGRRRYRILTRQAHSVALENSASFDLDVGEYPCSVFFKPSHADPGLQRTLGGTIVHLEFETSESDMLRAASLGSRLTEDVLAGLAVVTGIPFGGVNFVQLVNITHASNSPFLYLLAPRHLHSDRPIAQPDIVQLQAMLKHWDLLPKGGRIRRAASIYRRSLQEEDDLSAFQEAYLGLEALEPPLAEQLGVSPGVEEIKGNCESCGAEFVRRRTVLNGVRTYIRGAELPETAASPQREADWKKINALRNKQFHSLENLDRLRSEARAVVAATEHYLHDAICCLSHAHKLESLNFKLIKGAKQLVLKGTVEPGIDDVLEECRPVVTLKELGWDPHPEQGFVPRAKFVHDRAGAEIGGTFFWILASLDIATESDLLPANFESE